MAVSSVAGLSASLAGQAFRAANLATGLTGLDRFRQTAAPTSDINLLSPVEQGDAARRWSQIGEALGAGAAGPVGAAIGKLIGSALDSALAPEPHSPIQVSTEESQNPDGTRVSTVYIDVKANYSVDGGALPAGRTAAQEAASIENSIETDFSRTYTNPDGSVTRYVTRVDMTVGQPASLDRQQFILVPNGDSRLGGSGTLGRAPGFEHGRTAFLNETAGPRTAPHEFGHLAGLRHTAQVDQGCVTEPGINIENLMSQTGCSPTSHQIERSQLESIANNPVFQ